MAWSSEHSDAGAPAWLRRAVARLVDYRYWLLAVAVVLGAAGWYAGRGLSLDRSIENMFAPDDPILVPYRRLQRTFGRHEVVLAMYEDKQLKSSEGLARLEALSERLRNVPGVVAVVSLLDLPSAADFDDDGRGKRFREMFAGYTHNAELDAAGVMCLIERPGGGGVVPGAGGTLSQPTAHAARRETLRAMREIIRDMPRGALVGEPVLVEEAFDLLERDGRRLNTWCTALVTLTILACFRSVRWLVLPIAVVQFTLCVTNGTLVVSGLQLSMVSSMLGAIVTVVGVATVVHVMVHYQDHRRAGQPRREALSNTLVELAAPVTVAILTDSAGFAALMVSKVGPVHDFGLMMAIGSFLVLPACILLVPGLIWLTAPTGVREIPDDRLTLGHWLGRTLVWAQRWIVPLAVVIAVMCAVAMLGTRRLTVETDFTKNFREESSIVQAYGFVEERFGGAGVWDLLIPAERGLNAPTMVRTLRLEEELRTEVPQLNKAISLADALAAWFGGANTLSRVPTFMLRTGMGAMRANDRMTQFIDTLYNIDPVDKRQWIHVLLRSPEQLGAEEKTAMIEAVQSAAVEKFPEAEVTGYYVLLTRLIESVLADQWKAFIVATIVVGIMVMIALRDWRLTAVTFVPNIFPSLTLFGVMGWLGLRVNMGAAMIAAVSIGLSVDSSVHYTMFYLRQRRLGLSLEEALHRAQDSVGRAAVFSTLALTVGFGALVVSDFIPTIYFGVLVSLSMIGALVGNLLVLPVLIRAVERRRAMVSR